MPISYRALALLLPILPLFTTASPSINEITLSTSSLYKRATPVLPSGWAYSACIREPSTGRTLAGSSFTSSTMTVDSCVAACNANGYTHAGVEYADECYCGNAYQTVNGGGTVAPDSDCSMPCAGDATQICGGSYRLSVYATPSNSALPSGWSYYDCVHESTSGRTLSAYSFSSSSLTVASCINACSAHGFQYAGAEFGDECYCGNSFDGAATGGGTSAPGSCIMACAGDSTQKCGNAGILSVFATPTPPPPPTGPTLPTGWSFFGCVKEPSTGRTLSGYSLVSSSLTIESCVAACSSRGYTYAGAEYADECYCGNTFDGASSGGGVTAPPTDCNMSCAGNAGETCGGGYRLSVYSTSTTTPPPSNGYTFYGCVHEPSTGRTLTGYTLVSSSLTIELCITTCSSRGFTYAGAEYAKECYCGNSFDGAATGGGTTAPSTACNMPCAGNATETCGGSYLLSVWSGTPIGGTPPGAPVLPAHWSSVSKCITEATTGRALTGNSFVSGSLTLDQCIDVCDQTGFNYAGAEYGVECYCGNTVSTANGGGVQVDDSQCNMACGGNSLQTCGASYHLTLYTKTPPANPIPTGWSKNFCTVDQAAPRVLSGSSTGVVANLTLASCITTCSGQGFTLAGVENGNVCYCGNGLNAAFSKRDTECNTPCAGDATQNCGGPSRLMIYQQDQTVPSGSDAWTLTPGGTSGIIMTHVSVFDSDTVLIIDRKENNPLHNSLGFPAWGAVWTPSTNTYRALDLTTHSFCSTGSFLSNGTLANFGGQPYADRNGQAAPDGQQGVRLFSGCTPGPTGDCGIFEDEPRIRLASNRWYSSSTRLYDGSAMIVGGQVTTGWTNDASVNNPSYEFFPPKNINGHNGTTIPSQFFIDTLPHNTFPHVHSLPNRKLFVAANNQAMILDWLTNTETRLPNFPNGQRVVYPLSAAGALLPLTPENGYTPEILICGGSQISDTIQSQDLDAQKDYGSAQCSRMVLNDAGIAGGWQTEFMPEPRLMGDAIILPTGKVLILNGGRTGTAGYGQLQYRIGDSNADHPVFTPLLYDPSAAVGSRFSRANLPPSTIGRLYHSTATLLPTGAIMIGGSNPNDDVETRPWASEYRVEYLNPSYMTATRPTITTAPAKIGYVTPFNTVGNPSAKFTLSVTIPAGASSVIVVLMDLGFITHAVHMDHKYVKLTSTRNGGVIAVSGPPNEGVFSPGPGWLWVVVDGVPSVAKQVMVGSGAAPPSDPGALENMLAETPNPSTAPH